VKNTVYQVKINNGLQHLEARIRDVVATVTINCFKQRGTRSNIVWAFAVPPGEPILKLIQKVMYSETTSIFSICNCVIHKCV
jgi:hypothetical protein